MVLSAYPQTRDQRVAVLKECGAGSTGKYGEVSTLIFLDAEKIFSLSDHDRKGREERMPKVE